MLNPRLITLLGVAVSLVFISFETNANQQSTSVFMRLFDSDQDGKVTHDELDAASAQRFAKMDMDNDGKVSKKEFNNHIQKRRQGYSDRRYKKMDSNQDGKISKQEYLDASRTQAEHRFVKIDQDGNGMISSEELARCKDHHHRYSAKKIFTKLDGNGDGYSTKKESLAAWANWFKRKDTDKDGVVTREEIKQARAKRCR